MLDKPCGLAKLLIFILMDFASKFISLMKRFTYEGLDSNRASIIEKSYKSYCRLASG